MERIRQDGTTVSFRIAGDAVLYEKPYEELQIGGDFYLLVEMDRYGTDYLSERFLELTLFLSARRD